MFTHPNSVKYENRDVSECENCKQELTGIKQKHFPGRSLTNAGAGPS